MSDKMREEFEVWASQFFKMDVEQWGEYVDGETQWAWLSWKASRAALVVELPDDQDVSIGILCCMLDDAGVGYK